MDNSIYSVINFDPDNMIITSIQPWEVIEEPEVYCHWLDGKTIMATLWDHGDLVMLLRPDNPCEYINGRTFYMAKLTYNDINLKHAQLHRMKIDEAAAHAFMRYARKAVLTNNEIQPAP